MIRIKYEHYEREWNCINVTIYYASVYNISTGYIIIIKQYGLLNLSFSLNIYIYNINNTEYFNFRL